MITAMELISLPEEDRAGLGSGKIEDNGKIISEKGIKCAVVKMLIADKRLLGPLKKHEFLQRLHFGTEGVLCGNRTWCMFPG